MVEKSSISSILPEVVVIYPKWEVTESFISELSGKHFSECDGNQNFE